MRKPVSQFMPLVIMATAVLFLFGCSSYPSGAHKKNFSMLENFSAETSIIGVPYDELYYCEKDNGCAIVRSVCCACGDGNSYISINTRYEREWVHRLEAECKAGICGTACPKDIPKREPSCITNLCRLV